jgi:CBS domain-containing protein
MSNSKKFLNIFNDLEIYIRKLVNKPSYVPFKDLVNAAAKINPAIEEYANDLWEFAELRNALIHSARGEIIAEVSDTAISLLKEVQKKIISPPTAFSVASKPVYACQINDSLLEKIRVMKEKLFTHVPVYDGNEFIGVLSESSIFNWQCEAAIGICITPDTKVGAIKKYLDINTR